MLNLFVEYHPINFIQKSRVWTFILPIKFKLNGKYFFPQDVTVSFKVNSSASDRGPDQKEVFL